MTHSWISTSDPATGQKLTSALRGPDKLLGQILGSQCLESATLHTTTRAHRADCLPVHASDSKMQIAAGERTTQPPRP
eukprot:907899-Rhodomonas_salina.7